MTITNGYTTLADLKTYKRITSTDSSDDGVLERMIENASRLFDGETGRRFWTTSTDETRTYQALDYQEVLTDDIVSIASLKTDEDGDRTYEITWATTDYDTLPVNSTALGWPITSIAVSPNGNYSFPSHRNGVQIIGKFGFCAASTVGEARTFTASSASFVYVTNNATITEVAIDSDNNGTYETVMALTTDYTVTTIDSKTQLLVKSGAVSFPLTTSGVRITGTWNLPGVPDDVKMCIEEIVVNVYQKRFGVNTTGAATITGAGVVITPKDIPDTAWRTIAHYRSLL